ncbi:hypothetical protein B566_EDAN012566 [Ephemera danica]|nr:hypothetical protein B566_EDAN012566 [Ephemera danica]
MGSEYAKLQQEISTLEFQIKNPGRPVPAPRPIAHVRPPAIPVKLRPLTAQGCNPALTECQRATAEGQSHLRTEQQRIESLRAQIPEARRQNAQLQTRVNELRRQLQQRPQGQPRTHDNFKG